MNKTIQALVKLAVTGAAFYYVFQQLDSGEILNSLRSLSAIHWLAAIALYLASQWLSAVRLNLYLDSVRAKLLPTYNFLLYLIGMAYNFFLPGGIGGDGYKIIILKRYKDIQTKQAIGAFLADRLIGLVGILFLLALLIPVVPQTFYSLPLWIGIPIALIGAVISKYVFRWIWPHFNAVFNKSLLQSVVIQSLQVCCIGVLASGAGLEISFLLLTALFLASTIATAVPVFLGGLGAREMVFIWVGRTEGFAVTDSVTLVSVAVLFSIVTLISALPGLLIDWKIKHEDYF
jgi:hypothetical protein